MAGLAFAVLAVLFIVLVVFVPSLDPIAFAVLTIGLVGYDFFTSAGSSNGIPDRSNSSRRPRRVA